MAENPSYQFGPVLTDKIISVVRRVDSMPYKSGVARIPTRFEDDEGPRTAMRLGKTTALWAKGTTATITLYEAGTPPEEEASSPAQTLEDCVNKFANIQGDKWVAVARAGNGSWYLIAAECE